ncbi:MAG: DUF4190 domain-containing protein [Planctomycetota bacterium]
MTDTHPARVEDSRVLCAECGYDLSGTAIGGKCPECGSDVHESIRASTVVAGSDSSALLCLIFGCLSFVAGCTPLGFVAVWMYGRAKRAIAEGRAPADQRVMATIGVVLGWIGVALFALQALVVLFFIVLAILDP